MGPLPYTLGLINAKLTNQTCASIRRTMDRVCARLMCMRRERASKRMSAAECAINACYAVHSKRVSGVPIQSNTRVDCGQTNVPSPVASVSNTFHPQCAQAQSQVGIFPRSEFLASVFCFVDDLCNRSIVSKDGARKERNNK